MDVLNESIDAIGTAAVCEEKEWFTTECSSAWELQADKSTGRSAETVHLCTSFPFDNNIPSDTDSGSLGQFEAILA